MHDAELTRRIKEHHERSRGTYGAPRIPLLVIDEVGYIPSDPEAAALIFALVSSRYERCSLIVSSNKTFSAWAEIFGDPVAVAALVDRLVHHAEIIVLKGDSYRLKGKSKEVMASERTS
jgi:DNA replication protein DnaC